jgi:hypothetical protein
LNERRLTGKQAKQGLSKKYFFHNNSLLRTKIGHNQNKTIANKTTG